ncbi:MAG TPA: hypothetical protein VGJ91_20040 [Polyangiaceae bacterium]|jgi:hypothetical protein
MSARAPGDPRCKDCPANHEPGKSRCTDCAARHRKAAALKAAERRKAGKCVTCGGKVAKIKQGGGPAKYCKEHLAYYAARAT